MRREEAMLPRLQFSLRGLLYGMAGVGLGMARGDAIGRMTPDRSERYEVGTRRRKDGSLLLWCQFVPRPARRQPA
jgi:hypothetical protein